MAKKIYTIFASLFLAVLFFNLVPGKAMASITAIFDIIPDPGIVNQDVKIKVLADAKDANSGISTIDIFIDNKFVVNYICGGVSFCYRTLTHKFTSVKQYKIDAIVGYGQGLIFNIPQKILDVVAAPPPPSPATSTGCQ